MAQQYIFQMQGLTKAYPGGKKVFENIWLSFYPGAKIGVVGVNGSGKSTLLKIMAGIDKDFSGEAFAAEATSSRSRSWTNSSTSGATSSPGARRSSSSTSTTRSPRSWARTTPTS
jgi:ATPase subunit of ABC transporter with duplicated ATPase domains